MRATLLDTIVTIWNSVDYNGIYKGRYLPEARPAQHTRGCPRLPTAGAQVGRGVILNTGC